MDLLLCDALGAARRIMQADQTVYLHPSRVDLLNAEAMRVGEHNFPDVVLEVDHTTDVRRGKLRLYESWGFPELWVEVPAPRAPIASVTFPLTVLLDSEMSPAPKMPPPSARLAAVVLSATVLLTKVIAPPP